MRRFAEDDRSRACGRLQVEQVDAVDEGSGSGRGDGGDGGGGGGGCSGGPDVADQAGRVGNGRAGEPNDARRRAERGRRGVQVGRRVDEQARFGVSAIGRRAVAAAAAAVAPVGRVDGVQRHEAAVLARLRQRLASLHRLVAPQLVLVVLGEVVDDDRDRQRDDEHAADAADAADDLAEDCLRHDVAVAHRRHGDRRPPERARDARVVRVVVLLGEVGERREHEDADGEEHDEQAELLVAALQRVAE